MKKLFSVVLSVMMATMMLFTAFAANAADPTVDSTNSKVSFTKQLTLSNYNSTQTVIPNLTFSYTITPGSAAAATATSPLINAGVSGASVEDATFTTATLVGTTNTDTVDIDFSGCTFPEPGIYRYILQENASANANSGVNGAITFDTTYYAVDVYVTENTSGVKEIQNAVMYQLSSASDVPVITMNGSKAVYADNATKKKDTIVNTYEIYHLKLKKNVTGAMGEKTKDFSFTISLANGPQNTTLKGLVNGVATNFTFDATGACTTTVNLKHNQELEIWSLPKGTTYTITENLSAADQAAYTTTISGATDNGDTTDYVGSGTITASTNVQYTNDRSEITPTGLFMMYGPYVLMIAVAGALAIVFFKKRKVREDELFA